MKLRVWRKDPRARLPEKASPGAVGWDVFSLEDVVVPPKEQVLVRTGLVIAAPFPYAMFLFPRSSLFRKKGLIFPHSAGIIDFDYCGEEDELRVPVLNLREEPVEIKAGERIGQLVFLKALVEAEWEELPDPPEARSRGGFGSTGGYR
ncbi:MAG: dUTP diphosphatase [Thermodesulfobacteria bacterium]|nr:dUTP diphosphatase [Thermodesulfobacteriota bacterium]